MKTIEPSLFKHLIKEELFNPAVIARLNVIIDTMPEAKEITNPTTSHWLNYDFTCGSIKECAACGFEHFDPDIPDIFCPNCGAKMINSINQGV